jgi:nucleotide-binding universal stress UspA family protein
MTKPVLVGYDPRRIDHTPVDFGFRFARLTQATLIVASADAGASHILPVSAQRIEYAIGQVDRDLVPDCSAALEHIEEELQASGIKVDCLKLQSTSAARALHEAAEEVDAGLLVVGSSRRQSAGRVLAGSTAQRLLHGAPCPVAVVPRNWHWSGPWRTIGVAFVDTAEGREALHGAHALARRTGAMLRVITVVAHSEGMHLETGPRLAWQPERKDLEDVEGEHRLQAERNARNAVAELGDDVPIEIDAVVGHPVDTLVHLSQFLELLVCGSRGYGPLRSVLLGSVSRRLVAEAYCPLIVLARGVEASLESMLEETRGATAAA